MLARRTSLQLPNGVTIDLPRLVPAFSSKGFGRLSQGNSKKYSEVTLALELMGPFIKFFLLSGFDLHHGLLRKPERFYRGKDLIFIDSGGYELSPHWDSTEPVQQPYKSSNFGAHEYRKVLQKLPKTMPFVITNYDWGSREEPVLNQILMAQEFFNGFSFFGRNFLVKPGKKKRYLDVDEIMVHIGKLRAFHILGVTEKELGKDIITRLLNIAKLRSAMDRENVNVPIHIWGGLDPVISPLYFFAGAEIFDGVSWLRYAYHEGLAVYRDCYGILKVGIETPLDHVRALVLSQNITFLQQLTINLRQLVDNNFHRFDMFGTNSASLEQAYRTLCTKIPELKGGV